MAPTLSPTNSPTLSPTQALTFAASNATYTDPTVPDLFTFGVTVSLEAVTTNAILRGLTLYCARAGYDYDIQLWYTTTNFTAATGAVVRDSSNGWVLVTTSSITGTCPRNFGTYVYAPVAITGLNIPLTLGIKTGLSAVETLGFSGSLLAFYETNATNARPITFSDNRMVLYYASGGFDYGGSPTTIQDTSYTFLKQLVIESPST